jgi:hypothetical protein
VSWILLNSFVLSLANRKGPDFSGNRAAPFVPVRSDHFGLDTGRAEKKWCIALQSGLWSSQYYYLQGPGPCLQPCSGILYDVCQKQAICLKMEHDTKTAAGAKETGMAAPRSPQELGAAPVERGAGAPPA